MPTSTTSRRLRLCDVCGQLDDHPRHVQDGVNKSNTQVQSVPDAEFLDSLPKGLPASAIAELVTPNVVVRHIDCCAAQGCLICQATEAATKGKRGDALLEAIQGGALDSVEIPDVNTPEDTGLTVKENTNG